jgi:WD40 repeat protein
MNKFAIVGLLLIFAARVGAQTQPENIDHPDMLAYVSNEDQLMLYNPRDRTETKLLNNVGTFLMGRDGRVAFIKTDETDTDLYVFDPATPHLVPINISQNPTERNYPLAWSPDGRYLAFFSYSDINDQFLYVWDGETVTNVMPDNALDTAARFYVDWNHDGWLAFTIQYGWSNLDIPAEIYLWDGNTTTNLSQNPEGWDSAGRWSRTGQLMFWSSRDGEGNIYVWDGMSFKDGSPDVGSFIRLAPELEPDSAAWTDDGFVAFTLYSDSGAKEIILWDLEREAIVRRFPISSDKYQSWLAEGGQMVLSSHLASGIPSVYLDVENISGEILLSEHVGEFAWSPDSYLAYCGIEESMSRLLSLWNGEETWLVAEVSYKPAQWQNGQKIFSCDNG